MNIGELLGAMVQSGMSASSSERMKNSLGGGGVLDNLASILKGSSGQAGGGGFGELLTSVLGGQRGSGNAGSGGGFGEILSSVLSGGQQGSGTTGAGGSLGDLLSSMLGDAGKGSGGKKNLAIGGLGALIGSLLGGGKQSLGGAVGGGLMALLGALAFNALKGSGQQNPNVPAGLLEPQTQSEVEQLERSSELVLRAMINAVKADGQIDQNEINRLIGKFSEAGIDAEGQRYLMTQLQQPMETDRLVTAAQGQTELAAQMYGASLLAIEVDTQAEKIYLDQLAAGLGLSPQVTGRIREMVGLPSA